MTQSYTLETVNQEIEKICERYGKQKQEIQDLFNEAKASTLGRTDEVKNRKALTKLKASLDVNLRSSAVAYDIIVAGRTPPFNVQGKLMKDLKEAFDKDPSTFINGIGSYKVRFEENSNEPIFIDNKETDQNGEHNKNYGKDVPTERFVSNLIVAVKKPDVDQKWQPGFVSLWGDLAKSTEVPNPGYSCRTRLNGAFDEKSLKYELSGSSQNVTKFEDVQKIETQQLISILEETFQDRFQFIEDLLADYERLKEDNRRFVITEGAISFSGQAKKDEDLKVLNLTDASQEKGQGVALFVPPEFKHWVDALEVKDYVKVIGRHNKTKRKDAEGNETDEDVATINVYGIIVEA